jgi:hypothetical protein
VNPLTAYEMWYGRDEPPPEVISLRAGVVDVEFQDGALRYLRLGQREMIRHIYSAVRDVNWNTIPGRRSGLAVDASDDHFQINFDSFHEGGPLAFRWHATIEGGADGMISYTMDGRVERDFRYCRIGFCILHPVDGVAGARYRATTPEGELTGTLPELIEPQRMVDGLERPLFPACSRLVVEVDGGTQIVTEFEGDLFEMEDQRNWTDGSFKTYCTPIILGYPHQAKAGQEFFQKVTVRIEAPATPSRTAQPARQEPIRLTLGEATGETLPKLGFGMPGHHQPLDEREAGLIADLRPAHLKAELHLGEPGWPSALDRALSAAERCGCALELALFLSDDSEEALEALRERLRGAAVARLIVFHEDEAPLGTTSTRWLEQARRHLEPVLPDTLFVGGTNGNFAELNRQRPDLSLMDGVAYTINPQVHLPDERNLIDAIQAQHDTVVTARSFSGALPISVSSVTLKPPFNQAATEEEAGPAPGELPPEVDQRQISLFAAAWTVGSLRSLASGGADSVTYYETTGWRGLMETAAGSPLPDKFRSLPGMLFPVYWVFAFLAPSPCAALRALAWDEPLLVEGLAFSQGSPLGVLVANLQPRPQPVELTGLPDGQMSMRRLNDESMLVAATDPVGFAGGSDPVAVRGRMLAHTLEPYETAFIEHNLG